MQPLDPGEVVNAGSFHQHPQLREAHAFAPQHLGQFLPAGAIGRQRMPPATRPVGSIELRHRAGLGNIQSEQVDLCHGRWWVEGDPRGLCLWPGEKTRAFSGGKNTRGPKNGPVGVVSDKRKCANTALPALKHTTGPGKIDRQSPPCHDLPKYAVPSEGRAALRLRLRAPLRCLSLIHISEPTRPY